MAAHSVDPKSSTVNLVFPVEGVGELIVFESYVLLGTAHEEISGREVFLFDADGARSGRSIRKPAPRKTGCMILTGQSKRRSHS